MVEIMFIEDMAKAFEPLVEHAKSVSLPVRDFCGDFMYMYTDRDGAVSHFKHIITRAYLHLKTK